MKPFTQAIYTLWSRIATKPGITRWRIFNVMSSHLYAQALKVEKWQEMIWMPLLHPSGQSVEGREGISPILPLRGRAWPDFHMKIEFPPPSILPFFLPLLLCGSEYLCIRGGDRSTGRGKRDRGISLIWGTSGLGASLDTEEWSYLAWYILFTSNFSFACILWSR